MYVIVAQKKKKVIISKSIQVRPEESQLIVVVRAGEVW